MRAGRKDDANILSVSLFTGEASWKKISVSYLVTSRNDLALGSFIIDTFSASGCSKDEESSNSVVEYVPGLFALTEYKVFVFVSGIKTIGEKYSVSIWEPRVEGDKGLIYFNVLASASVVNLHVSYVIWSKNIPFSIYTFESPSSVADYEIVGIAEVKDTKELYTGLALDFDRVPCKGFKCQKDCTSEESCKKNNGLVVEKTCFLCGTYEKFDKDKCVPDCRAHEVFVAGKCECEEGFIRLIDKCISKCGINQV